MKKILTLLLSVGIFSASFAQSNHQRNQYDRSDQYATASNGRYDHHNDRRYDNNRNYSYENQQSLEIQKINEDYNYQVMSIENNRFMRNHQKKVALRNAERDRDQQIQRINAKYDHVNRNWERR
jgi:hypothetical protein